MAIDTLSLEGKVAIITGSGRENGIGAGIALALTRNKAAIIINYQSDSTAQRAENVATAVREAGGKAVVVQANVDTLDGAKYLVKAALEGFQTNHVDILGKLLLFTLTLKCSICANHPSVNNAGTGFIVDMFSDINTEEAQKVYQINVNGPLYMINAVVSHMPPGGRIINISSIQSKLGSDITCTYGASKAALENLTWSWAKIVGPDALNAVSDVHLQARSKADICFYAQLGRSRGITVNSIAPGPVPTDIQPPEYA